MVCLTVVALDSGVPLAIGSAIEPDEPVEVLTDRVHLVEQERSFDERKAL